MTANVIKIASSGKQSVSVLTKEVHEASTEAKKILVRAEERAAEVIAEAEHAKEAALLEGAERGYAEGLDRWNNALIEAWRNRDLYLAQNEAELVKLSVAIAGKLVASAATTSSEAILYTARQAMRSLRGGRIVKLKVNPADEVAVGEQIAHLSALSTDVSELIVIGSPSVEHGGCIVETELGSIDARISTQLASIEKALLGRSSGDNS